MAFATWWHWVLKNLGMSDAYLTVSLPWTRLKRERAIFVATALGFAKILNKGLREDGSRD